MALTNKEEALALQQDTEDSLASYRKQFHIPRVYNGNSAIYFCGNSLGLQPKGVQQALNEELNQWATVAAKRIFDGPNPWFSYHEVVSESALPIVGAKSGEVVLMNSTTTNLHLMMVSFYRPKPNRYKILIEKDAFPSDRYTVESQLRFHGYDPITGLMLLKSNHSEHYISTEEIESILDKHGEEIALVLIGGVNYLTGQYFDIPRITAKAKQHGCKIGFDLSHAAGNVVLKLHDWEVDFAVWCTYKYLNSGPGSVAGCFVHDRYANAYGIPRFAGWWGNDPATRFEMLPTSVPQPGAAGWQLSNPPILAMVPCKVSHQLFNEVGMESLRVKSEQLTGYLETLLNQIEGNQFQVVTPKNPAERGCQLSVRITEGSESVFQAIQKQGVMCDFRKPDIIRVAPVPFYNSFHDVLRFAQLFRESLG